MGRDFNNQPDYSDEISFQIGKEMRRIVDESYDTAADPKRLIEEHTIDVANLDGLAAPRLESNSR